MELLILLLKILGIILAFAAGVVAAVGSFKARPLKPDLWPNFTALNDGLAKPIYHLAQVMTICKESVEKTGALPTTGPELTKLYNKLNASVSPLEEFHKKLDAGELRNYQKHMKDAATARVWIACSVPLAFFSVGLQLLVPFIEQYFASH